METHVKRAFDSILRKRPVMSTTADPAWLSATEALAAMRRGDLDSETLVRACLNRIATREPEVQAWAHLDPDRALSEARERDRGPRTGVLHGLPIGVKDVIDVAGLPTACGSIIHAGATARVDAACVALARASGAVVLGKTHTAEFANTASPPTRNPHAFAHTPGGSSSGSAAAVADGMVPLALGTQTVGSTIRPAAFCGIVGFKPSFGRINRAGLKFSSESLDTIGLMARGVADVALLAQALAGIDIAPRRSLQGLRVGVCRGAFRSFASPGSETLLQSVADRLAREGAQVEPFEPDWANESLREAHQTVMLHELARATLWEYHHHREALSERFRQSVEQGLAIDAKRFARAKQALRGACQAMAAESHRFDGILTFAATGEAPEGLASTGDSIFSRVWTALELPCVSLPAGTGSQGLPLAVQWVGMPGEDEAALSIAAAIEAVLANGARFDSVVRPHP
jgi:Asp-tRNA(Asn)/Glu-tRNA(Gln) amidotransferase A subunit family amidase